jgi:hypothetical protein
MRSIIADDSTVPAPILHHRGNAHNRTRSVSRHLAGDAGGVEGSTRPRGKSRMTAIKKQDTGRAWRPTRESITVSRKAKYRRVAGALRKFSPVPYEAKN